jgi:hypothetical protein
MEPSGMGIWAGALRRRGGGVEPEVEDGLRAAISRYPGDVPRVWRREATTIVAMDVGILGVAGATAEGACGPLTVLAGDPLVRNEGARDVARDVRWLHDRWAAGAFHATSQARGTFCAAHVAADGRSVSLVGDRLALRPIYYAVTSDYVFFATALRILEALPHVVRTLDVRAVMEARTLGHLLGDRTPYEEIRALDCGEVVHVNRRAVEKTIYWRLDTIPLSTKRAPSLIDDLVDVLRAAVSRRVGADRGAAAFLSGGLDSRTIVALLRERGASVYSFNFALAGTQDQIYGRRFAQAAGVAHVEHPRPAGPERWSFFMSNAWRASADYAAGVVEHPDVVWSGDGGSVVLGHLEITQGMVEAARAGRRDEAVQLYLDGWRAAIPTRVLRPAAARALENALLEDILDEVERYSCEDPGRVMWVWRMQNDQHRHMLSHFEDLDLHRLEFHLPLYDGDLIDLVGSMPIDLCLRHRLYAALIPQLPSTMRAAPWQAYPDSVARPVPEPTDLMYQWGDERERIELAGRRWQVVGQSLRMLTSRSFPSQVVSRGALALATAIHALGARNLDYLLDAALAINRYWRNCEGRVTLTRGASSSAPARSHAPLGLVR